MKNGIFNDKLCLQGPFKPVFEMIFHSGAPGYSKVYARSALAALAEKQAQANVITRREEVASTRSLLNTAKLMDENQTLYKLKELEYVERICENVGNISLNGNGNILSQLTAILNGNNV